MLEKVSGYTAEQAKAELVAELEEEIRHEQAQRIVELEEQYREEADDKACRIMALAIQRCAGDFVAESTISSVALPSEEMKGRIIGREGRNIQKLETLTGVELIIDDTPEVITISGFDPIRREVARLALEKLISDGRIHPTRIEEMVEKAKKDVDAAIKQAGERATFEVNIHGINPDLVRLLGRLRYRTSYGQNVLQHSIEVAILAGIMAEELGVDPVLARRAGLLHDIGKAFPYDVEGSHVQIGVNAAKKYKEGREVVHAIEAHHGDVEPQTVIAVLVQAADAISAARPGARREDMENYIKRLEKLEEIAEGFTGIEKAFAIQAGRELRVMVKPEDVTDEGMKLIAREMAKKIQDEVKYPGQIKVNLIRESRMIDYAK
jgi:ribonuclease Y